MKNTEKILPYIALKPLHSFGNWATKLHSGLLGFWKTPDQRACRRYRRERKLCKNLARKPERKRELGDLNVDWRMILIWILKELSVRAWTRLIWLRIGRQALVNTVNSL
jgi:hypothetical protein